MRSSFVLGAALSIAAGMSTGCPIGESGSFTGAGGGGGPACPASSLDEPGTAPAQAFGNGGATKCALGVSTGATLAAVAIDTLGNAIVAGWVQGGAQIGDAMVAGDGALVAVVDPACNVLWVKRFAGDSPFATGVAADPTGGFVVIGAFGGFIDVGAGPIGRDG